MDGDKKVYLRSLGKFQNLEEIGELPVKGTNIRLRDIADIRYDVPKIDFEQRIDQKQATLIGVFKESTANTVNVCRALRSEIDQIFEQRQELSGFTHYFLFDQGELIIESINNLKNAALWGFIFAVFILFLFLRQVKMTMIVTLAIPISILIALIAIYFVGFSLNLLTMMGLMLCVGLVVDNSIVSVENIFRLRQQGATNVSGALHGASEIALAITMATLTTVVVFVPLILMNEDQGFSFYMWRIGFPVCVALVASLVVALLFIPLATSRFSKGARAITEPRSIVRLKEIYARWLRRILERRFDAALFVLLAMIVGFSSCGAIERTMEEHGHINDCWLVFDLPDNYTMEEARSLMGRMENTLYERQEKYHIKTVTTRIYKTFATMNVFFQDGGSKGWYEDFYNKIKRAVLKGLGAGENMALTREEILEEMKELDPGLPGVEMRVGWGREDSGDAALELSLYGDDTETLAVLAEEVKRRLSTIPEILSIDTSVEEGGNEIQVSVDRQLSRAYGIETSSIGSTVRYALGGIRLPDLHTPDREIATMVRMKEDDRETLEQLKNLSFSAGNGEEIPLGTLANFEMTRGFGTIRRMDRKTRLSVKAITTKDNLETLYEEASKKMAGFEMPHGYSWAKGERFQRMEEDTESFIFAIYLAVTFVFLLMGVLFESFLLPVAIIFSIVFALPGVFLTLFITGTKLSIMAYIGIVILAGIVVNNAIVLLDLVNRLRAQGLRRLDAIVEAGKHRFRPILMTTFTTIFGLIPMSLGNVNLVGIPYAPLGIAMMGGLFFSTFLTLLFVPLIYTLMDDLRGIFIRIVTRNLDAGAPGAGTPQAQPGGTS
jgi:HAE1 family hydrophobic/amphiphilic exporter-1